MTNNYFYEVDLLWNEEKSGILSSGNLQNIEVNTHAQFVLGKRNKWTPEQIIAGAVSYSFMTTFLELAENLSLQIFSYKSNSLIKLQNIANKLEAKEILIRPIIQILNEKKLHKAKELIDRAEKECSIKNFLTLITEIHPHFEFLSGEEKLDANLLEIA